MSPFTMLLVLLAFKAAEEDRPWWMFLGLFIAAALSYTTDTPNREIRELRDEVRRLRDQLR